LGRACLAFHRLALLDLLLEEEVIVDPVIECRPGREQREVEQDRAEIFDPDGPGGQPLGLFESGAILIYLAEKTGRFLSADPAARYQTIQWLMWQMGGLGPMFGQLGFFNKFAGKDWEDKRPRDRYVAESKRLLAVLDRRLDGRDWIVDDYSIADIATLGWVRNLITFYESREIVDFDSLRNVPAWLDRGLARPAVQRGLTIPTQGD